MSQSPQQTPPWATQAPAFAPNTLPAPADPNAVLMGASAAQAASFVTPGDRITGTIVDFVTRQERAFAPPRPDGTPVPYVERQLLTYPRTGDPIMGIVITLQTALRESSEDDGRRALYAEGKRRKDALRAAVRAAGARGLEVGALLEVVYGGQEVPTDPKSGKIWHMRYAPPSANAALAPEPIAPVATPVSPFAGAPVVANPWAQQG